MDQEDSFEVKTTPASIEPPKTPNPNVPDSIPSIDSDSSLSEEETITNSDNRGIISLSPLCTQYNDNDSISDCVLISDEEIMESIYQNLLRIVFSLQIQHVAAAAASASAEIWCFDDDGCKTPPPSSRSLDSNTVPGTCPGAPMKLTKITRKIDSGLRRKLF